MVDCDFVGGKKAEQATDRPGSRERKGKEISGVINWGFERRGEEGTERRPTLPANASETISIAKSVND